MSKIDQKNSAKESGDSGIEKSAILLMALGEDDAAEVLKHLGPKEVQNIGQTMAKLRSITREQVENVFLSFNKAVRNQTSLGVGNESYIRKMMIQALGEDKAAGFIDKILMGGNTSGLDTLKWMDPRSVADLIRYEHPQIQAIVLSYLEADQAAGVLSYLEEKVRLDIITRISSIDSVQPQALQELNDILERQFANSSGNATTNLGGIKCAANIMNYMDTASEATLIESIREMNEELATELQELMFVFDNISEIDDRGIQVLLREISSDILLLALRGADQKIKEKVFKNMSKRAADLLKDDLASGSPVKLSDVETAQKEILSITRRLAESGEIILGGKGGEELI